MISHDEVIQIKHIGSDARKLTQAVIQVVDMLDLYQAELARILHLQCSDIGLFAQGKSLLKPGTEAWYLAAKFIQFYRLLYRQFNADGVLMRHWLRRRHVEFAKTPHLLLVDDDRLSELIRFLDPSAS